MNCIRTALKFFIFVFPISLFGQQTIGLFENSSDAFNGYTLFASLGSQKTYLIDNCGEKVHEWNSSTGPGNSMYLLNNGILLRTKNVGNTSFPAGGTGGGIEMLDWESNVIWTYTISSDMECQHHDISYLPNGNILAIVWERISSDEVEQAGREEFGSNFWSEKIVEIAPDLDNGGGIIVWEWRAWDHLIQDFDETKDNFGVVSEHPELLNVNFHPDGGSVIDWLHINSVDYNEELDQILLSVNHLNEIWVIDHSTSTEEAAGHSGGIYGKGGDFLYRWGNPISYDSGTIADQTLGRQHDAEWIETGTDEGNILIFNNRQSFGHSSVLVIEPPLNIDGSYVLDSNNYGPENHSWIYEAPIVTDFFSSFISGSQRLDNGNTFICEGANGRFFEVKDDGTIVWEYINPTNGNIIFDQGQNPMGNFTFRATKLAVDHPGLTGQDLSPQGFLESGSSIECELFVSIEEAYFQNVTIYPNPSNGSINLDGLPGQLNIEILDLNGRKLFESSTTHNSNRIDLDFLQNGVYLLRLIDLKSANTLSKRIFKY